MIEKCKSLFAPPVKSCTNAINFGRRVQRPSEPVNDFATDLMILADSCDFGSYKDKAMRNQLISGLHDRRMKAELMAMDDKVEFRIVLEKAVAIETVDRDLNHMDNHNQNMVKRVHRDGRNYGEHNYGVGSSYRRNRSRSRKGQYGRNRSLSGPSNSNRVRCYSCQGMGHIAKECPSIKASNGGYRNRNFSKFNKFNRFSDNSNRNYRSVYSKNNSNHVEVDDNLENINFGDLTLHEVMNPNKISHVEIDDSQNTNFCNIVVSKFVDKIDPSVKVVASVEYINAIIENKFVCMEIDTGACVSLCTVFDYNRYFAHVRIVEVGIPLSVLTGEKIRVLGKITVNLKLNQNDDAIKRDLIIIDTPKKTNI